MDIFKNKYRVFQGHSKGSDASKVHLLALQYGCPYAAIRLLAGL